MVGGWHRHVRGQVDYFIVINGALKICANDHQQGLPTKRQLDEVVASGEKLQAVHIPRHYWHGTKSSYFPRQWSFNR